MINHDKSLDVGIWDTSQGSPWVSWQDADVVDAKLPRVAFFANRNIAPGEDLGMRRLLTLLF